MYFLVFIIFEYIQANSMSINYKNALFLLLLNKTSHLTFFHPAVSLFPYLSFSRFTPCFLFLLSLTSVIDHQPV